MNPAIFVNLQATPNIEGAREVIRYDDFVRKLLKPDTPQLTALHIGLGVAGELAELIEPLDTFGNSAVSTDNLFEELGDLEFYVQAAHNFYNTTIVDTASYITVGWNIILIADAEIELVKSVGNLVDAIKREYIYGKPRELGKILNALGNINYCTNFIYTRLRTSREHILQCNAIKLQARYTSLVYSSEAAIARADKPAGE